MTSEKACRKREAPTGVAVAPQLLVVLLLVFLRLRRGAMASSRPAQAKERV